MDRNIIEEWSEVFDCIDNGYLTMEEFSEYNRKIENIDCDDKKREIWREIELKRTK